MTLRYNLKDFWQQVLQLPPSQAVYNLQSLQAPLLSVWTVLSQLQKRLVRCDCRAGQDGAASVLQIRDSGWWMGGEVKRRDEESSKRGLESDDLGQRHTALRQHKHGVCVNVCVRALACICVCVSWLATRFRVRSILFYSERHSQFSILFLRWSKIGIYVMVWEYSSSDINELIVFSFVKWDKSSCTAGPEGIVCCLGALQHCMADWSVSLLRTVLLWSRQGLFVREVFFKSLNCRLHFLKKVMQTVVAFKCQ